MRKIENKKWTINYKVKNEKGEIEEKTGEESLIKALSTILSMSDERDIPKGFDKFRSWGKISKVFDKAERTGFIEIEDAEYLILKELIKNKVPAVWATNPNIENAITSFMDAEPVGEDK